MRLHRYGTYRYISITYCIGMLWCIININLYVTNHIYIVCLDMDINVNNKLRLYKNHMVII